MTLPPDVVSCFSKARFTLDVTFFMVVFVSYRQRSWACYLFVCSLACNAKPLEPLEKLPLRLFSDMQPKSFLPSSDSPTVVGATTPVCMARSALPLAWQCAILSGHHCTLYWRKYRLRNIMSQWHIHKVRCWTHVSSNICPNRVIMFQL